MLVIENSGESSMNFLSDTGDCIVYFGDTESATAGSLQYIHAADSMRMRIQGATYLDVSASGVDLGGNGPLLVGAGNVSLTEMAAPGAGAANSVRIYAVVDGGSLTDLAAVFQDGTIDNFAQEV